MASSTCGLCRALSAGNVPHCGGCLHWQMLPRQLLQLSTLFGTHGPPDVLVSDNGTCFTSNEFEGFLKRNDIQSTRRQLPIILLQMVLQSAQLKSSRWAYRRWKGHSRNKNISILVQVRHHPQGVWQGSHLLRCWWTVNRHFRLQTLQWSCFRMMAGYCAIIRIICTQHIRTPVVEHELELSRQLPSFAQETTERLCPSHMVQTEREGYTLMQSHIRAQQSS